MAHMPKLGSEVKRKRVLTDDELRRAFRAAASRIGWPMGSAIQLLMLTTARREQCGLRWDEIDAAGDVIHFIGSDGRTKHGEDHDLPLSGAAPIAARPRLAGSGFVFTTTGVTPISGWKTARKNINRHMGIAIDEAADGFDPAKLWRIHDLRRTAATWLQSRGVGLQVVEALFGHIGGSRAGIVGVYQVHDYAAEKREAIEMWGAHLAALVAKLQRLAVNDQRLDACQIAAFAQ